MSPGNTRVLLAARTIHRIENSAGQTVTCLEGDAWISQEGGPHGVPVRRVVRLRPGEWFFIDRTEPVLLIAVADTAIVVDALPQGRADSGACAAATSPGDLVRLYCPEDHARPSLPAFSSSPHPTGKPPSFGPAKHRAATASIAAPERRRPEEDAGPA